MLSMKWTAIATRPRQVNLRYDRLTWTPLRGAPMSIAEAHQMAAAGMVVMANRHFHDAVELVVKPVAVRASHVEPALMQKVVRR